ncbi:FMN-dependent NADH-azoreductase [Mesorhizobium sp. L-8-3]|uniref:FMN-dependent NADH-azoreductase n=1 Tax=Mesorhizobium sp. L-8-3 TaxID=2744522 RepID=UPI001926609A|nr:FMN-dependent NADH-azoreductase [Mesorhizobium sp. L-8-3]BCH27782.1 FMN-dependent NADH-azoreductase [Mesorhizobium sp. L-8-3]
MPSILLLTTSPRADSYSTKIATELAEGLRALQPASAIVHRNLATEPLPHIDDVFAAAIRKPADKRSAEESESVRKSDELVAELLSAGTLVIGTGLINFSIYASLKTWIDHVARAGLTFKYTEKGPIGLARGKKAYIVLAAGGVYSHGPAASMNHAVPYLHSVLGFMGITDIETIYVEGVSMGVDAAEKAVAAARIRIGQLALVA